MIYADNAATTKLNMNAFEAMKPFLIENYANASQPYSFSRKAKMALKDARAIIADCINAKPDEIFFTSGGTESDNWAIKNFTSKDDIRHIITSSIEHHAVLNACNGASHNSAHIILSTDEYGLVIPSELEKTLSFPRKVVTSCDSILISIMLANNEIGTIQPIKELAAISHSFGACFHTDAVQAVGHIPIDVRELGVDMLSASAHKFNGPKGIGFLYSKNAMLQPLHNGGSQEYKMRAGTENIPAIIGMAEALRWNIENLNYNMTHLNKLTDIFYENLHGVDYIVNGSNTNRLPGNINISIKGKSGESLLHMLDLKGIMISTGSACDGINTQVSHVIKAIKVPKEYAEGTIRITFGHENTEYEAEFIAKTISKLVNN